ncbi:hypothetical protein B296_00031984 [Ensete ventricosum]|uniref:Uncharacterized protein n=1 Tax=Ensete ventricosum TaxID=4639 RepID=A0A426Z3A3_ENSVE|nr:hypothetical protein B296_00031984 [Ensete ventricosum]
MLQRTHPRSGWLVLLDHLSASRSGGGGAVGSAHSSSRLRPTPETKTESHAMMGVPSRTRPTGTIHSCWLEWWNERAHHANSAPPPAPTRRRQQLAAMAAQDLRPTLGAASRLASCASSLAEKGRAFVVILVAAGGFGLMRQLARGEGAGLRRHLGCGGGWGGGVRKRRRKTTVHGGGSGGGGRRGNIGREGWWQEWVPVAEE